MNKNNTYQKEILRIKLYLGFFMISAVFSFFILIALFFVAEIPKKNIFVREGDSRSGSSVEEAKVSIDENTDGSENRDLRRMEYFDGLNIEADSVVVLDINKDEVIFERNSTKSRPLASITKVMTMVVALENAEPSSPILIDTYSFIHGSGELLLYDSLTLEDLAKISMITSSNEASYAIASAVGSIMTGLPHEDGERFFVSEMNRKARSLGLGQTFFNNSTGLDVNESTGGGYSSARDVADLMLYALHHHPGTLYYTRHETSEETSLNNFGYRFSNTNPTVSKIDGILASKTGYTRLAGGNLAVVVNADFNYPVIIVVMGSSREGRFEDVGKLLEATKKYLRSS